MIDFKTFLSYLNETELSADELIVLFILNESASNQVIQKMGATYFKNNLTKINYKHIIAGLQEKGYVINFNKPNEFVVNKFAVSVETKAKFFVEKKTAFDEVLEIYPQFVNFNGVNHPTYVDLKLDSQLYYDLIHRGSKRLHERFIKFTSQYLKENGFTEFAPKRFDRYLASFEGIAMSYEKKIKPENKTFYDNLNR